MKKDIAAEYQLSELIFLMLEGVITPEQKKHLAQRLREDPAALNYYVEYMMQYSALIQPGDISVADLPQETASPVLETSLWLALSEFEQKAEAVEVERPVGKPTAAPSRPANSAGRKGVSKLSLYALLLSTAALVFLITYALLIPPDLGREVATLTGTLNARWDSAAFREGMRLSTQSRPLWLREGMASIQFDNGSTVVLEGPAEFSILTDDQVQLRHGRLYASVPGPAVGFTVSTPYSKIIDLGTEFGVKTDPDGMEVHVMAGKTMLISALAKNTKNQCELQEGQAKAVTAGGQVEDIAFRGNGFVRRFSPQTQFVWKGQNVNLADIVGGG
ncbi:MAG TPA: FecR family protein, partial [Anaerohalosphaeraceae bacterium]|nr:FecR family protein [Anaerohalosphaeraceae bacterium]